MCSKIENDISGGRIISFDFCKHEYFGQIVEDIQTFFTRLMGTSRWYPFSLCCFREKTEEGHDY
jgi:hypothetical protein